MKAALATAALCAAAGLLLPLPLGAQTPLPVRRAVPVQDVPVARAVPVESPTPEVRRALPVPADVEPAAPPPTPAAKINESVDGQSEQAEPPAARQLNYANGLFARKMYDLAIPEYEKFLGLYPDSPDRASALFYLGEAYRALGRTTAARTSFQSIISNFPESEFVGPASYGVAEAYFNDKDFAAALSLFHRAAERAHAPPLVLSSRYFEARCLESLGRKDEARDRYQQVIAADNPNPFRDDSRLAVGAIFLANNRDADALKQFEALAGETKNPALKAEATVRAGLIALELAQPSSGKPDKALLAKATALLQKGRNLPKGGRWNSAAAVGLLRLEYQAGQYAQVVADYSRKEQLPDEVRPEVMLLVANSQRQLGHYKQAQDLYEQIIRKYPNREEAKDARYQHLIALYNANDPGLPNELDEFIKDHPEGERADQARLLKAESLYKARDFAAAATVYTTLRDSQLSAKLRAEAAFKLGWCFVETKEPEKAIEAFTYFLRAFPESDESASALTQRALAYQETKQYERALADLNELLAKYPKAREREAALQQKALLLGQTDDAKGMTAAFQQLLKEFPKTAAAAQAHYYIGKAAFDVKDYDAAIPELKKARELNRAEYGMLASLRIMSAYFYGKQPAALAKEVDAFLTGYPNGEVPGEILDWLGLESYNAKDYASAAKYLGALGKAPNVSGVPPDFWFYLGDAQMKLNQPEEAGKSLARFLETSTDPAAKAKALLSLGEAKIAAHKPEEAEKIANEIMSLQPEGRVNAQARLLAGEVQMERNHFEDAGKAFMSVALLYEDPLITPQALDRAAKAYDKAGKPDQAERARHELHEKYPDYASG